jgi:sugar phosphate isomerase/epimerase
MRIGLQLYSVKEACAEDLDGTIAEVARQGYAGVEPWNLHDRPATAWRELLDRDGLVACGWHVRLERIEDEPEAVVEDARALSLERLVVPSLRWPDTLAGVDELVERVRRAAERLAQDGIALGFHNHGHELEPREGVTPLERLAALDPQLLFLEIDVGWAYRGGADPVALLRQHAGRVPLIHLKDEQSREGPSAVVGEGVVPIGEVIEASGAAGVDWLVVEVEDFDEAGPLPATARCFTNVSRLVGAA